MNIEIAGEARQPHGLVVVTTAGEIFGEDSQESRELARRVQACVNACEGIATQELERGIVREMRRTLEELAVTLQPSPTRVLLRDAG